MQNNWKESFRRTIINADDIHLGQTTEQPLKGDFYLDGNELECFIETEVIEKLIEEIPDGTGYYWSIDAIDLKKELKAKWLGKETV